jgi:AraC family transcriptional regulator, transcriptional activator of pobA
MTEDARILSEYRIAFRRMDNSGVIDMDRHLKDHFNFQIHRFGAWVTAMGDRMPLLRQSLYFLNFVTKGSGEKTIGSETMPIRRNVLYMIPKRMVQASTYWPGDFDGYILGFNLDFFLESCFPSHLLGNKGIFRHAAKHYLHVDNSNGRKLSQLYEGLLDEYQHSRQHRNESLVLKVLELLITCDRLFAEAGHDLPEKDKCDIIDRFDELIRRHYAAERSVAFYARALHVHPNHLNAVVKKNTGLTAKSTIMGYVLSEARHLINSSELTMKEIAHQLGFENPDQLSALFRRHLHVTPKQFKTRVHS